MPRTGAQNRGIKRERQVRELLEAEGWWVSRASGSLGDADLVALRMGQGFIDGRAYGPRREVRLIEVKSTTAGPFSDFGPKHRAELIAAAEKAGAEAWLVHWPPRQSPKWIPASEWPAAPAVKKVAVLAPADHMGPLPAAPPGVIGTIQGAIKPDQRGMIRPKLRRL